MLQDILNSELEKVPNGLMSNKPTVNITTTNYVIFKVRQRQLPSMLFNVKITTKILNARHILKFLGVYVGENLNWKDHVNLFAIRSLNLLVLLQKPDSTFLCHRSVPYILPFSILICNREPLFGRDLRIKLL